MRCFFVFFYSEDAVLEPVRKGELNLALWPGSCRGGGGGTACTVRACVRNYGKESVNVFVNDLSHVVKS